MLMKKDMNRLKSNQGSALVTAMVATFVVGLVSVAIFQQTQVSEKQLRLPKIKSSMVLLETKVLAAVDHGNIIRACVGLPGCFELNPSTLAEMNIKIPGAQCNPGETPCGAVLENANYDSATRIFTGTLRYQGTELLVKPVSLTMQMSSESWLGASAQCPLASPLLAGFNSDGSPICRNLPPNCNPDQYISMIDPMQLNAGGSALNCQSLPSDVTCPAGQFIGNITWNGGGGLAVTCITAVNPFTTSLGDPTSYGYTAPVTPAPLPWLPPPLVPLNGSCGLSHGTSLSAAPATNLCSAGTASVVGGAGPWSWSCEGVNGGSNANCSASVAPAPVNGICGSSHGATLAAAPTTNLCSDGNSSAVAGTGPWSWSCSGVNGGSNANCSASAAPVPVNGICGSSHGATLSAAPTTNLCSDGNSSAVAGTGPWSWSCSGVNGGSNANCSANLVPVPVNGFWRLNGSDDSSTGCKPAGEPSLAGAPCSPIGSTASQYTAICPINGTMIRQFECRP